MLFPITSQFALYPSLSLWIVTASHLGVPLMTGCGSRSVALVHHNADSEPCCALLFMSSVILFFVIGSMNLLICCLEGWSVICTLSMYLVVLASSSAFSFTGIPMWLGIQLMCTILFVRWCCLSRCLMSVISVLLSLILYCCIACKADLRLCVLWCSLGHWRLCVWVFPWWLLVLSALLRHCL